MAVEFDISLPDSVSLLLERLQRAGYSAYVVGGCVRDALLGITPNDWDLTTSAKPEEIAALFSDFSLIDIGAHHGTIGVHISGETYEITTYRTDGDYTDHRHPGAVSFLATPEGDLARRDFTVNAMAYHPAEGLIDLFGGQADLKAGVIRAVGDPAKRFEEDALRILRGLRFASKLGFSLDEETAKAMEEKKELLVQISAERIAVEWKGILCGKAAHVVLGQYASILLPLFPEMGPMLDCAQNHPYHNKTVWEHTLSVIQHTPPLAHLRLAAFFHDMGKPLLKTTDERGIDHFKGHEVASAKMAREILLRLKLDRATVDAVSHLVAHHDEKFAGERRTCLGILARVGEAHFDDFLALKRADAAGKHPDFLAKTVGEIDALAEMGHSLLAEGACYRLSDLRVKGGDLMALGLKEGKEIGRLLGVLLEAVLDESCPNEKEALLRLAKEKMA